MAYKLCGNALLRCDSLGVARIVTITNVQVPHKLN